MKMSTCLRCNKTTFSLRREKQYCGSEKEPGSCAFLHAREKSGEWNRRNYYANKTSAAISAHKIKKKQRYVDGEPIEMTWLNF